MLGKINKKARKQIYVAQQTTFEGPGDEIFTLKFALWVNEQILDDKGQILDPIVGFGFLMQERHFQRVVLFLARFSDHTVQRMTAVIEHASWNQSRQARADEFRVKSCVAPNRKCKTEMIMFWSL